MLSQVSVLFSDDLQLSIGLIGVLRFLVEFGAKEGDLIPEELTLICTNFSSVFCRQVRNDGSQLVHEVGVHHHLMLLAGRRHHRLLHKLLIVVIVELHLDFWKIRWLPLAGSCLFAIRASVHPRPPVFARFDRPTKAFCLRGLDY